MDSTVPKRRLHNRITTGLIGCSLLLAVQQIGMPAWSVALASLIGLFVLAVGLAGTTRVAIPMSTLAARLDRIVFFFSDAAEVLDSLIKPQRR